MDKLIYIEYVRASIVMVKYWIILGLELATMVIVLATTAMLCYEFIRWWWRTTNKKLPPGPKGWPIIGNWFLFPGGKIVPKTLQSISQKYGDLCLIQVGWCNLLVVSSPELAKEVLLTRGGEEFGSRSLSFLAEINSGGGQDMVFADYGDHWRRMRRLSSFLVVCQPGALEEEIDSAVADIRSAVEKLPSDSAYRPRHRLQLIMYNVLYRMLFNRRFSGVDDRVYHKLSKLNLTNGILLGSFKYNLAEFFPIFRPFFRSYCRKVEQARRERHAMFDEVFIPSYLSEKNSQPSSKVGIEYLIRAESKEEINHTNLNYLLQNMNVAALGTTTAVSKWAVLELVNHPEEQRKIYEELKMNGMGFGGKRIREDDVKSGKLKYVEAFTKEVLRMHMAVPMLVPRRNKESQKLGGYHIPKNCRIIVNAWGMANDSRYWDAPEEFKPSRFFMTKNGKPLVINPFGSDFHYIPFGSGCRSCPGSRIAYYKITLLVAKLVQSFHLLPPLGTNKLEAVDLIGQLLNLMVNPMPIILKPRIQ